MNRIRRWNIAAASAAAILVSCAAPAFATVSTSTLSLTDSWTDTIANLSGTNPRVSTSTTPTSNLGTVTPMSNPHTQTLTLNTPTTGEILFVVDPNGSGAANITVGFQFSDNLGGTGSATDTVAYFANQSTDYDTLTWTTNSFNVTLSDGQLFSVNLPNETDWNMAQQVTFKLLDPTAVPEPASLVLLAAGVAGLGLSRRKRA